MPALPTEARGYQRSRLEWRNRSSFTPPKGAGYPALNLMKRREEMDNWLKALIAAACTVVIAGGAYFGWSEYRSWSAVREVAKQQAYLYNRAISYPGERQKVEAFCDVTLAHIERGDTMNEFINLDGSLCRRFGFDN